MKLWLYICLFIVLLLGISVQPVMARDCLLLPANPANLGTAVPSTEVRSGMLGTQSGFTVECNRIELLGLLDIDRTDYVVEASQNNFQLSNGRHSVAYQLSSSANFSAIIDQVGQGYTDINASLLTLINNSDIYVPLFVRTLPSNISAGEYSDQLTIRVSGRYCVIQLTPLICLSFSPPLNATFVFNISLTIDTACNVQMPAVHDFGSIGLVSDAPDYRLDVNVDCTIDETYQLHVDMGNHASNGWRELRGENAGVIRYHVLQPQQDIELSPDQPMQRVGIGGVERIQPRVRLDPAQVTPAPGLYSDTVRAVVSY